MSVAEHRKKLAEMMADNSIAIVYAGHPALGNEDEYLPFLVNSQFFYLTAYERPEMIFVLAKTDGAVRELLFIEEYNELKERWTGKRPTREDARVQSGIEDIYYLADFESMLGRLLSRSMIDTAYFDLAVNNTADMPSYQAWKAQEFHGKFPGIQIRDLRHLTGLLRECKDEEEIALIRRAIEITGKGLEEVLARLKPGLYEHQVQAIFEGSCHYQGAKNFAFPTISAGGKNACSMHYSDNDKELLDGQLILLDLGAKYKNYCSDITRTYPVNGHFTERQKTIYNLVLKANEAVARKAAPGVTLRDLQELTCQILGEGLVELGLLDKPEGIRKYYMHGVSHFLGIDAHDVHIRNLPLQPGCVISNEPGLYIDEEEIGIRIEDDLLITEDGCEVLSAGIPKTVEDIERIMSRS